MAEYVNVPEETDPDVLAQDAFEYLESKVPTWEPHDAQLDTWIISAVARMIATLKDTASDVRTGIFRWFGATVMQIAPIEAHAASSSTTWTLTDTAGHTIPAGTTLAIPNAAGELIPFETTAEVVVPVGQSETGKGEVPIQAVEPGQEGNGLGIAGTVCTLEDQYPWVQTGGILLFATTSGGVDEETDEAYLNRLVSDIRLMAIAPIVAENYAVIAKNITGVYRSVAINLYNPEVQAHTGDVATGSAIIKNLTEAFVKKLTVGTEVSGEGVPIGAKIITLEPATGGGQIVISVPGESTHATTALTFTGLFGQEKCVTVGVADENGNALSAPVKAEVKKYLEERREVNYLIFVVDPTYTVLDVEFEVVRWPGWEASDVQARCIKAIEEFLNPGIWGRPPFGDKTVWYNRPLVKVNDIITVLGQVQGVKDVNSVKMRRHAIGAYGTADITLTGVAALPKAGTLAGTVM
jgi:hypothetical protein